MYIIHFCPYFKSMQIVLFHILDVYFDVDSLFCPHYAKNSGFGKNLCDFDAQFCCYFNLHIRKIIFSRAGECPAMYQRFQWGAAPPPQTIPMPPTVPNVVIHHSATRTCTSVSDCFALIKSFQTNHMTERGWDDIAYS